MLEASRSPRHLVSSAYPDFAGERQYHFCDIPLGIKRITVRLSRDRAELALEDEDGSHLVSAGIGCWLENSASLRGEDLHHGYRLDGAKIMAGARWLDRDTLEMTWFFLESVFVDTVVLRLADKKITLERSVNANSGARAWPILAGTRDRGIWA
jgi:hypothetical protein